MFLIAIILVKITVQFYHKCKASQNWKSLSKVCYNNNRMPKRKNKNKWFVWIGAFLVVAIVLMTIDYFLLIRKKNTAPAIEKPEETSQNINFDIKENNSSTKQQSEAPQSDNSAEPTQNTPTLSAEDYYNDGISKLNNKEYQSAIESFAKAIEFDTKKPEYYSKKSEAEVLAGKKAQAIETIKLGLVNNPGDVLLKNKLDILQTVVK